MKAGSEDKAGATYEGLSEVGMRQLLRRLLKEKDELEWKLKDCEWRLDQEATVSQTDGMLHGYWFSIT